MSDSELPGNLDERPRRRRRGARRQGFIEALQQSQLGGPAIFVDVGKRLREIRIGRNFSIRELAKKSDLNVNTLSMVENGKTSPSIETLQRLAFALEMPVTAFFEEDLSKNKVMHYKASHRPSIAFAHGTLEDLGAGLPRRGAETFLVTLKPLSSSGENLIVHTGREIVYCLEGQLTYTIDDQTFLLEQGDSLCFEAHLPHCWENRGTKPSRSLLVLCPYDEQDRPTERHFMPETAQAD